MHTSQVKMVQKFTTITALQFNIVCYIEPTNINNSQLQLSILLYKFKNIKIQMYAVRRQDNCMCARALRIKDYINVTPLVGDEDC